MTMKEAYNIYKDKNPKAEVDYICEGKDCYFIGIKDSKSQGYEKVDKSTGKIGFAFWGDYFEQIKYEAPKWININEVLEH